VHNATQPMIHRALRYIDRALNRAGKTLADYPGMPTPPPAIDDVNDDGAVDFDAMDHQTLIDRLNVKQLENYHILMTAIDNAEKRAYFLDCPGGTGLFRQLMTPLNLQAKHICSMSWRTKHVVEDSVSSWSQAVVWHRFA
jgi:hypothetical protein